MTRPLARNGLGLTVAEAERQVRAIEAGMSFLPDGEPGEWPVRGNSYTHQAKCFNTAGRLLWEKVADRVP